MELWQGPDNKPQKFRVYSEDGKIRPFRALIELPCQQNTLAVKNIGPNLEFPLSATVADGDTVEINYSSPIPASQIYEIGGEMINIQGGALRTYPLGPETVAIQIVLQTMGLPLCARLELSQGTSILVPQEVALDLCAHCLLTHVYCFFAPFQDQTITNKSWISIPKME